MYLLGILEYIFSIILRKTKRKQYARQYANKFWKEKKKEKGSCWYV